ICCSAEPKFMSQIDDRMPFVPNEFTNVAMRTAGSAKLPSVAVHACVISGHGQDDALQDVSAVDGVFQCTVYGVAGPVIAPTTISLDGAAFRALMRAASSATDTSVPAHSDDVQFCSVTVALMSLLGAIRGGRTSLHRWPNSLQRKFAGGPSCDATS